MAGNNEHTAGLTRRMLLLAASAMLAGCVDRMSPEGFGRQTAPSRQLNYPIEPYDIMYGGVRDGDYKIRPVPYKRLNPDNLRQIVHDRTLEPIGTVVIDPKHHYLYVILDDRKAVRYGIATGPGFPGHKETLTVSGRESWPVSSDVRKSDPKAKKIAGPNSLYGARALYLSNGMVIHGTSRWREIGGACEAGGIAMLNQDVMDLDRRIKPGARVLVL
ncbi:L,D-transpeptidase [Hoeflea poritis]|uniref:L,D-transpeptidase n=1 Tax=Hoeflea poritis TaxID=2993659 RepID=A0ABT4VU77_9HYPH|nr:L,D-transpeptidase [Hoeflea poritis]MDA4848169.1 L,D-transpeptidase [Hoeflea poritis]